MRGRLRERHIEEEINKVKLGIESERDGERKGRDGIKDSKKDGNR